MQQLEVRRLRRVVEAQVDDRTQTCYSYLGEPGLIALTIDGIVGKEFDLNALWFDYFNWCQCIPDPQRLDAVLNDISGEHSV